MPARVLKKPARVVKKPARNLRKTLRVAQPATTASTITITGSFFSAEQMHRLKVELNQVRLYLHDGRWPTGVQPPDWWLETCVECADLAHLAHLLLILLYFLRCNRYC